MRKERKIINTNIRLNLCDEQDRQAWEYLQTMDREKYKSYTRAVVVALNDYFSREYRNEADPYLETREKEDAFLERVETAVTEFKAEYKKATGEELTEEIPTDLLTASGSGLDPHISPASAKIQVPIVAANTGFEEEELYQMVEAHTEHKALGIFGEERVNVLKLNLDLARKLGVTA